MVTPTKCTGYLRRDLRVIGAVVNGVFAEQSRMKIRGSARRSAGFTIIELMVSVAIVAILASIALSQLRDYTRRAKISEAVLATSTCKNAISENYATLTDAPAAGRWGCETSAGTGHVGSIQTSSDGVARVAITNVDGLVNGRYIYMIPVHPDGVTPMITPDDMGRSVVNWMCGSDWLPVRNALPANCRADATPYASQDFN